MSLFEWFGESRNPGPVGDVECGAPEPTVAPSHELYARGFVGTILVLCAAYWVMSSEFRALGFGLLAVYLLLAYFVNPRPDYSNFGMLGGLIDHPFRWSDDINRQLAFFRIFLLPGRFAVVSIRDVIMRASGRRTILLKRTED